MLSPELLRDVGYGKYWIPTEKHNISDTEFLVDDGGYLTSLFRHDLSGQINYTKRNHIEEWFQTVGDAD